MVKHVHSLIADEVALLHFTSAGSQAAPPPCDACGGALEDGEPFGKGLLTWTRGDELRWEEPGLCERCAHIIGLAALRSFAFEDEES